MRCGDCRFYLTRRSLFAGLASLWAVPVAVAVAKAEPSMVEQFHEIMGRQFPEEFKTCLARLDDGSVVTLGELQCEMRFDT